MALVTQHEFDIRDLAARLALDAPPFTEAECPALFRQWADRVEVVGMLAQRDLLAQSEIDEANRFARMRPEMKPESKGFAATFLSPRRWMTDEAAIAARIEEDIAALFAAHRCVGVNDLTRLGWTRDQITAWIGPQVARELA